MKMTEQIWHKENGYTIVLGKKHLDLDVIHRFLSEDSYWSKGISRELVERAIENSALCFGVYKGNPLEDSEAIQVGFARVVSDLVRYAWLGDVFILPEYRGIGLSKWLMSIIVELPYLKGTSFNLGTADAHQLYEKFGFRRVECPNNKMARPLDWDVINKAYETMSK